ncbi:uncharacterized protein LOC125141394 isoform X1 [Tachysurus fulvidraco]|uniref:uncharacterized protein LOC125141394 isoform X1 n=1 Tax=Tachysurus fulvidraco TaxID=1234273 RepID=UPI001FEF2441|nr:uncharacterized protein LOC125141394 isoform X1 [Tachysurus fulvidraco]
MLRLTAETHTLTWLSSTVMTTWSDFRRKHRDNNSVPVLGLDSTIPSTAGAGPWGINHWEAFRWRWSSGQHDNFGEECGALAPWGWVDVPCTWSIPAVCLDGSYTGHQNYIYISTTMSWLEAQASCRQHHTDLSSSSDANEDSVIKGLVSGWALIGLFRDSWKVTDQTNFLYHQLDDWKT